MPQQKDTRTEPSQVSRLDRTADEIERMLALLETAIRPMGSPGAGPPDEASCGLFGTIYSADPTVDEPGFRLRLAELMIEYNIDRVDVAWFVPQVVKRFARNRGGPKGGEPVGV